jgi:hypothetical protein
MAPERQEPQGAPVE